MLDALYLSHSPSAVMMMALTSAVTARATGDGARVWLPAGPASRLDGDRLAGQVQPEVAGELLHRPVAPLAAPLHRLEHHGVEAAPQLPSAARERPPGPAHRNGRSALQPAQAQARGERRSKTRPPRADGERPEGRSGSLVRRR